MSKTQQSVSWHRVWPEDRCVNPRIVRIHWYRTQRKGKSGRIQHPFWVLDYTASGRIRTRVGSPRASWLDRASRIAHLYPPGTCYWEWPADSSTPVEGGYVVFQMTPATLLTETFMRAQGYARIADPEGLLETVLREGARAAAVRTDAVSFWRAQSSLCALLAIIASATPAGRGDWRISASAPLQDASHLLVSEVDEYLQAHLGESVVLGELARIMGVSTSSLSHRYKSLAGRSPLQALRRLRIERAKTLLLQGYKQDDIAAQCGFYDAAHFSRTFSQLAGQSPRRFVRS